MSGEVIHLRAYQAAIFRGSRDKPEWDFVDTVKCERELRQPAVRERIEEIAQEARAQRDRRERIVLEKASSFLPANPNGGRGA